jgi:hypothetical protein
MVVTRPRTARAQAQVAAQVAAVKLVAPTEAALGLSVKATMAAQAQVRVVQVVAAKAALALFLQVVQVKPLPSPVQALPMRWAEAQIVVARVQAVQAMVVAEGQVVSLAVLVVQGLL